MLIYSCKTIKVSKCHTFTLSDASTKVLFYLKVYIVIIIVAHDDKLA